MNRILIWLGIAICCIACFASCGGKKNELPERKFNVGVCVAQETEASRQMRRAIEAHAAEEDANIIWESAGQNEATQEQIFEQFYRQGVKGIIFEPVNPLTAGILIQGAIGHGIPIAGIGDVPQTGQLGIFVMPDLQAAAEDLVRQSIDKQHTPGRVLILTSQYADSMETRLINSILALLKENGSAYKAYGLPSDSVDARRSISSILFTPKIPSIIIATNGIYAMIAEDLVRLSLASPRPVFACYSPSQNVRDALDQGKLDIVVDPQPSEIGRAALSGIMHLIKRLPINTHADVIRVGELLVPVIKTPVKCLIANDVTH